MRAALVPLLICVAAAATGCQPEEPPQSVARPVRSLVVVSRADVLGPFVGAVQPRYTSSLAFRTLGVITSRTVNIGDRVNKGERLASLDPIAFDLNVSNARAVVAGAAAQYANVAAAETRVQILFDEKHATPQQLEAIQQARVAADAAVKRARSLLDKALEQRSYTEMAAEFDGVITAVNFEIGQVVTPGQPVVTIARPDIREAVIDVPDDLAGGLRVGSHFNIVPEAIPVVRTSGDVREIAPSVDPLTRSRRVRISLPGAPDEFRLGTTITATAATGSSGAIVIPVGAVFDHGDYESVWVVDPEKHTVAERPIVTRRSGGPDVTVLSGLTGGERIVEAGIHELQAGQVIRLSEEETRP